MSAATACAQEDSALALIWSQARPADCWMSKKTRKTEQITPNCVEEELLLRVQTEHFGLESRKSWDYLTKSVRRKDMPVKRSKRKFKAKQLVLDIWELWITRLNLDIVARNQQLSQWSPVRLLCLWLVHPEVPAQIQQGWSKTCPRLYKVVLSWKEQDRCNQLPNIVFATSCTPRLCLHLCK